VVTVSADSRYKGTFSYVENGIDVFGPFQPPPVLSSPDASWAVHTVSSREVGFPDVIAHHYYGDGSETLWWAVCLANGIVDPDTDMYPGQKIYIPPRDVISRYVSEVPRSDA